MSKLIKFTSMIFIVLFTTSCSSNENEPGSSDSYFIEFSGHIEHVHGLGYVGNSDDIYFASHDGLKIYKDDTWYQTSKNNNDYMGFSAVDKGFYTSGHPGRGVDLPNPLGIMRSFDNGQTLEELAFKGESDFHAMDVGYFNHTIYLLNSHQNSKLDHGLYTSKDDGKTWEKLNAKNLSEKVISIAVHPTDDQIVAIAAEDGIFLSNNGGNDFTLISGNQQGTAVFLTEKSLFYGTFDKKAKLNKYNIATTEIETINLPDLTKDAVMYLAQNPQDPSEIVFISFKGSVFITNDSAKTWNTLVNQGEITD